MTSYSRVKPLEHHRPGQAPPVQEPVAVLHYTLLITVRDEITHNKRRLLPAQNILPPLDDFDRLEDWVLRALGGLGFDRLEAGIVRIKVEGNPFNQNLVQP